jgi:hypothetical protein
MASHPEQGPTDVTGSPVVRGKGARTGEVLGERYEVLERLGRDAFCTDHRAHDQETERACIVRLLDPQLLGQTSAEAVVDKLSAAIGVGNRFLPGLLDADVDDKGRLYVVEAPPHGASLREVLTSRRARGGALDLAEVLPVVASLAAAVEAIPPPFHHGDVRLDRIWLAEDGLSLTFPFVVSMLPPSAVAGATQGDPVLSRTLAPELGRGMTGRAADRFGVACVVYECLTGELPTPGETAKAELGAVGEVLTSLLVKSPRDRASTLDPLVEAIAFAAGLPMPSLDAGAYRKSRRSSGHPTSGLLLPPDDVVEPTPMGAPTRNRRGLMTDTIEEPPGDLVESTAKVPTVTGREADALLGRARAGQDYDDLGLTERASPLARTGTDEPTQPRSDRSVLATTRRDGAGPKAMPKPVRPLRSAGAGSPKSMRGGLPEGAARGGTQEILAEELEEVAGEDTSPRASAPSKTKQTEGTQQILAEDILEDSGEHDAQPAVEGTQQVRAEDILEARSLDRTGGDDRLAPHLMAAVLANEDSEAKKRAAAPKETPSEPDIDPRLMRAALGVEIDSDDAAAPSRKPATRPVAPPPGRLPPSPHAEAVEAAKAAQAAKRPGAAPSKRPSDPVKADRGPAPRPSAETTPVTPPKAGPPPRQPAPKLSDDYDADEESSMGTSVAPHAAPLAARQSAVGKWILIAAVVLAALIILGGVLIASQRRTEAERERRLQQRFLELQQESGTTPDEVRDEL